jgi:hypothetical protein
MRTILVTSGPSHNATSRVCFKFRDGTQSSLRRVRISSALPHNHVLLAIGDTRMTGATLVKPRAGTWNHIGATHHNRLSDDTARMRRSFPRRRRLASRDNDSAQYF